MKLLVDNSVISDAQVAHLTIENGPSRRNKLLTVQARPAKEKTAGWKTRQIESLPTIARLAQEGQILLFTYEELVLEEWQSKDSFSKFSFGDIFGSVELVELPSAVRRGLFFPDSIIQQNYTNGLAHFVQWLLETFDQRFLQIPSVQRLITHQEISNLQNLEPLKGFCKRISNRHYADAFHLWTGHVNDIPRFLTTDKKLINIANQHHKIMGQCVPISPEEVLRLHGVSTLDEMPFEYGQRYSLSGHKE